MSTLPDPPEPVLETAARELTEATAPHPRIYEVPPEQGRKILADLQGGEGVEKPPVDEQWVDVDAGPHGTVRTRIVRPAGASGDLPVLVYIHGAGWVFGDENTHDRLVRELVVGAGVAAVFPVYDRAPEAKYPVQIEQNYAAAQWVGKYGREYGLDPSRIAVAGDSVGGNMAAVLALMAVERGDVDLRAQVLLYPVTDAGFETASYRQFTDGYYLTRDEMKWFWDQYLPDQAQRADVYASPLQASEDRLAALPTTLLITDEADVLRDEGEAYAAKMRAAGVDVTTVRVAGMVHDFMMLDSLRDCRATVVARTLAIEAVRRALVG
ncbi:alpha/beta hydrolase [Prescottella agglutinans]|uniref:Acetyl esterase n=1 Tax=Prescottella agglutinans TaxID=1644129 RepID=A0ABT6MLJ4_9NOCA|nr:alpha/beta hydrolase [Prescottella agglutinans]MDH6284804.1 acetyl esterase [Prescottella agglutinans]